jgi:cytochrome c-type biogenesis protein
MSPMELIPLIVGAGALDSVNPCAFSILFLTIVFLFSMKKDRRFILRVGGIYILGIALTYILIGLGVLRVLDLFNVPSGLAKFGAIALMLFAVLSILDDYVPNFPIKLKIPQAAHGTLARRIEKASVPSALGLGILVGLFEFPCTGGPYLFILGLLHDHSTWWTGLGYLVLYNFVFVLPLIIILIASTNRVVAERIDAWRKSATRRSRLVVNLLMVALGVIIFLI